MPAAVSSPNAPFVILGGGLSGMATAHALARAGVNEISIIERGPELGGLAGTFEMEGKFYPLGYHHILHRDRTLLYFLDGIGALPAVRWRRIRMYFRIRERLYDLGMPIDFLRFPMRFVDKLRFARLMLRSFGKIDWSDWHGRSAEELLDGWAGKGVREAIFEPLCRLKFDRPAREVSGAWLGARLYFREGSAPLGYLPGRNWTKVLCDGLDASIRRDGVSVHLNRTVNRIEHDGRRVTSLECTDGSRHAVGTLVSTIPTEVYHRLVPQDTSASLGRIRYTALISVIAATHQRIEPDFYWMNLASLDHQACGIFLLDSLNPSIGAEGDACVNFVTHLPGRDHELFQRSDEELLAGYGDDFERIFGKPFEPFWTQVNRVAMYSPIFGPDYVNPPVASETLSNVFFSGNYRTFPSVASTGTAMESGLETAEELLGRMGKRSAVAEEVRRFRLRSMPRP